MFILWQRRICNYVIHVAGRVFAEGACTPPSSYPKCPFCNSDRDSKSDEEQSQDIMTRVVANDAASIYLLANDYYQGLGGLQEESDRAKEILTTRAADLGASHAHCYLGAMYEDEGDLKKAKFHIEAAAMAGHEVARCNLGIMENSGGNIE
jgi:TPR repeat protein